MNLSRGFAKKYILFSILRNLLTNAHGQDIISIGLKEDVYDKLYGDNMTCGIRLINGAPYSAAPDCKESLAAGRNEGLKIIAIAVVVIVFALL